MSPPALEIDALWSKMRPDRAGLVPAVVQELRTRRVLMVAWVSREALAQTFETGLATFWSRSRRELWQKGATSGHRQRVLHVRLDCDGDTLLYLVEAQGPACHEGYTSCFSWRRVGNGWRREPEDTDPPDADAAADARRHALGDAIVDALRRPSAAAKRSPTSAIRVGAGIEHEARALANALQLKQRDRAQEATLRLVAELIGALDAAGIDRLGALAFEDPTARQGPAFEPPPPGASALSRAWSSDPDPGAAAPPAPAPAPAEAGGGPPAEAPSAAPGEAADVDEWAG
jgi:phosphoribosyl-AMP cyclohydrolase